MAGLWAATGGSAIAGEDSESAARRELFEELSIRTVPGELVYGGRMRRRNSFTDIWLLYRDIDPATLVCLHSFSRITTLTRASISLPATNGSRNATAIASAKNTHSIQLAFIFLDLSLISYFDFKNARATETQ
jgi:hypothetical protein